MRSTIRLFLFLQTALFAFAAVSHFGVIGNRNDSGAGTAESVIALVLLAGLAASLLRPEATRTSALAAQGFALLGTMVGLTLVLTVGPTTAFDVTMHLSMLGLLLTGLALTIWSGEPGSWHSLERKP